jgi:hypothetical protein
MYTSLDCASLLGPIDNMTAAAPTTTPWCSEDYTVLNTLHAAINEDATDMILAWDQTAHHHTVRSTVVCFFPKSIVCNPLT